MIELKQSKTTTSKTARRRRYVEQGYVMVAVLAAMTISLIFIAGALPAWKHESQREREEEMFFRAEQIAKAIERFAREHNNQYPTSLEQLTQENATPGQTKRYLRESALKDPMTMKGEWKLVRPGDPAIKDLIVAYGTAMKLNPVQVEQLLARYGVAGPTLKLNNDGDSSKDEDKKDPLSGAPTGPIVGVVTKSKGNLIRNYFGLDTYSKAIVLAGIPTPRDFVIPGFGGGGPIVGAPGGGQPSTGNPQEDACRAKGGLWRDGACYGVIFDGICPPSDPKCRPGTPR